MFSYIVYNLYLQYMVHSSWHEFWKACHQLDLVKFDISQKFNPFKIVIEFIAFNLYQYYRMYYNLLKRLMSNRFNVLYNLPLWRHVVIWSWCIVIWCCGIPTWLSTNDTYMHIQLILNNVFQNFMAENTFWFFLAKFLECWRCGIP